MRVRAEVKPSRGTSMVSGVTEGNEGTGTGMLCLDLISEDSAQSHDLNSSTLVEVITGRLTEYPRECRCFIN